MIYDLIPLSTVTFLSQYGYYGLFGGTFLSALFLPMGSDLLFIGMLAAKLDPVLCFLTASIGNWLGGIVIYGISYSGNKEKIEKWFKINPEKLERQKKYIDKYGSLLALIVWIPVIGDLSTVALGFYRTKPIKTFILMFIGRSCRFSLWLVLFLLYANRFVNFMDKL